MAKKRDVFEEAAAQAAGEFEDDVMKFDEDEEGEAPEPYKIDAAREAGEAIEAQVAADPRYEATPEGVADSVDVEREERAKLVKKDPLRGLSAIEREQLKEYGMIRAGRNAGVTVPMAKNQDTGTALVAALLKLLGKEVPAPAVDTMGLDIGGVNDEGEKISPKAGDFILVQSYGGTWKIFSYDNLDVVAGFVQTLPGLKRLFRKVEGSREYQEINGLGLPVKR